MPAQSNAVFGKSIVLHIINVMDLFSVLVANCASVIISLSNFFFKPLVEREWIRFVRCSAIPVRMTFASHVKPLTFARTKNVWISILRSKFFTALFTQYRLGSALPTSVVFFNFVFVATRARAIKTRIFDWIKLLSAICAVSFKTLPHVCGVTVFRTISTFAQPGRWNIKCDTATLADYFNFSSPPIRRILPGHMNMSTFIGTIFFYTKPSVKWLVATQTNLNHVTP